MALDAYSEALLERRRRAGIAPVSGLTPEQVRATRSSWSNAATGSAPEVGTVFDRVLPDAYGGRPVRIYRPANGDRVLPGVVFLHGGGWVIGDLDHSDVVCRHLCRETGFVLVSIDYRLAPEHKYPSAAEDVYLGICWIVDRGAEIGVSSERVAVVGSSAGGNLAAVATLMCRDRGGPLLGAQVLVYPVTDAACVFPSYVEFGEGYIVSTADMRWYWRQYLAREEQAAEPYASPCRADDLTGLPPALVITAECDSVRDDGERYADRLRESGVAVRLSRYPGVLHGFFAQPDLSENASTAVTEAADFLRDGLAAR